MLPVSIVIPTYGRGALLARFLPTYLNQDCAEIIIVDDGSDPPVADVLPRFSQVRVIRNHNRMQQPASRMIGVASARQPFVFFGEDDVYLSPGHVRALYEHLKNDEADVVATSCIITGKFDEDISSSYVEARTVEDLVDVARIDLFSWKRPLHPLTVPWLHTLALMPKSMIDNIQFDPGYTGNALREETDFYLRAYAAGARLAFVPGPPAFHYKGPEAIHGGQHPRHVVRGLLWYEYHAVRNNYRFLVKNRAILLQLGPRARPFWESILFLLRRMSGYPGRLRWVIRAERSKPSSRVLTTHGQ